MNIQQYQNQSALDRPILDKVVTSQGWTSGIHHISRTKTLTNEIFQSFGRNLNFSYWIIDGFAYQCAQSSKNGRASNLFLLPDGRKTVAEGSQSRIQHLMNSPYVISKPKNSQNYDTEFVAILNKIKNLPNVLDITAIAKRGYGYPNRLIMPRMNNDLLGACKALRNPAMPNRIDILRNIFLGITNGLFHLHSWGICHLDLKADNILINRYFSPFITDLGCAKYFPSNQAQELFGGTIDHASPEYILSMTATMPKFIREEVGIVLKNEPEVLKRLLAPISKEIGPIVEGYRKFNREKKGNVTENYIFQILQKSVTKDCNLFTFEQATKIDLFALGMLMGKAEFQSGVIIPGLRRLYRALTDADPNKRPSLARAFNYMQTLIHTTEEEELIDKVMSNLDEEVERFPAHLVETIEARLGPNYDVGFANGIRINEFGRGEPDSFGTLSITKKV